MPKYLIADFIVEIEPKFDYLKKLCEPFLYEGERSADFSAIPSDSYLNSLLSRMVEGSTIDEAEEFATASIFNRKIIHRGAMLVHSSALVFDGKAYLFSADSVIPNPRKAGTSMMAAIPPESSAYQPNVKLSLIHI